MSKGTTDLPVDPFRDREASNYENPIPSREHLLEVIRGFSTPNNALVIGAVEILNMVNNQSEID